MNERKINQILRNQHDIMMWIGKSGYKGYFKNRLEETNELLYPEKKPSLPEKTKHALRGKHDE